MVIPLRIAEPRTADRTRKPCGTLSSDVSDQDLSETMADPKLPAPAINLARANLCPTSDFRDYGARRSATIARFCSALQRRRRSGPVMTSTLAIAPSLTPFHTPSPLAPVLTSPTQTRPARPPSPAGYAISRKAPIPPTHPPAAVHCPEPMYC